MSLIHWLKVRLPTKTREAIRDFTVMYNLHYAITPKESKAFLMSLGKLYPEGLEHQEVLAHMKLGTELGKALIKNYLKGKERLKNG